MKIKRTVSKVSKILKKKKPDVGLEYKKYSPLSFKQVERKAYLLAERIESRFEEIAHILLRYESYEVVCDEIERTLDLLRNIKENEEYFKLRVGAVTAFLPRNQPLYALTCFVIIPSLMASEVHFRIPHSMRHFFPNLLVLLDFYTFFPNVTVSHKERSEFLTERSALLIDPKTKETKPVTDVVIFTGTSVHADQLRLVFDERTLFITNGAGHNPVVVTKDANLAKAVAAVLSVQLYNQGQDCAAPNAILIHKDVYQDFLRTIRDELRTVKVGQYVDRSCRVGPISEPKDLVRIQDFLIRHRECLDPTTPGIIRAHDAILEPTIVSKPLKQGGNFSEIFAPILFLQKYEKDSDLAMYFEDQQYAPNAMYITVYGKSAYLKKLINREIKGKMLHDKASILYNTHLHAKGIERGTQPYGGYGYGASNLSIHGKITPKPTLPQRDIYEWVAKPLLEEKSRKNFQADTERFTKIHQKDVQKLLRLKASESSEAGGQLPSGITYIDLQGIIPGGKRYLKIEEDHAYHLLDKPNATYIAKLKLSELKQIRDLRTLLLRKKPMSLEKFSTALYAVAVPANASKKEKQALQLLFFKNVYELLFAESSGPRLAQFLIEVDKKKICELLDV